EPGPKLLGNEGAMLVGQPRPLLLQQADADLQMTRLVAADVVEDRAIHRMRGRARHPMKQGRGRNLAHHERREDDREGIALYRGVVTRPVASAVVVKPVDVV